VAPNGGDETDANDGSTIPAQVTSITTTTQTLTTIVKEKKRPLQGITLIPHSLKGVAKEKTVAPPPPSTEKRKKNVQITYDIFQKWAAFETTPESKSQLISIK
jgi:hypothetical protein